MSKIHIVTARGEGWIMPKYGNALAKHLPNTTHGHSVDPSAKIHIYLPYYNMPDQTKGITVSYFTHREEHPNFEHRRQQWKNAADRSDLRISMSKKYLDILSPRGPSVAIPLPVLESQVGKLAPRKYKIGVSTRHYPTNRKGKDLVTQLLSDSKLMKYIELVETNGKVSRDKMAEWYRNLDFYLCTSTVEGGPLGILEAEICNVRTIAPSRVGWCDEFASIFYQAGSFKSLRQKLRYLVLPNQKLENHNEKAWAAKIKLELDKWQ